MSFEDQFWGVASNALDNIVEVLREFAPTVKSLRIYLDFDYYGWLNEQHIGETRRLFERIMRDCMQHHDCLERVRLVHGENFDFDFESMQGEDSIFLECIKS